jgi:hypothetical protein
MFLARDEALILIYQGIGIKVFGDRRFIPGVAHKGRGKDHSWNSGC